METKEWYKSKTIIGLAVMLLGLAIRQFGLPIAGTEIEPVISFIFEGIGGIMVLVGRLSATKKITR